MAKKSNQSPPSRCFDLRDASGYLRISTQTLRGLIRDGKISIIRSRPGAKILVDILELEAYIAGHTVSRSAREEVK